MALVSMPPRLELLKLNWPESKLVWLVPPGASSYCVSALGASSYCVSALGASSYCCSGDNHGRGDRRANQVAIGIN